MSLCAAEASTQEFLNQLPSECVTDHKTTETNQIEIVVFNSLVCRKLLMNQARTDSRHFVRGNGCANAAAADGHSALNFSAGNGVGQRHNKIWIIIVRAPLPVAEINYLMPGLAQLSDQIFLQLEATMVGGNADAVRCAGRDRSRVSIFHF